MKNKITALAGILVVMFVFTSCFYDNEEELYPNNNNPGPAPTVVTWSTNVKPIIDQYCATSGCHVAGAQSPDLSTYTGVFNFRERVKVRATVQDNMPASGALNQANQDALAKWINDGALNN